MKNLLFIKKLENLVFNEKLSIKKRIKYINILIYYFEYFEDFENIRIWKFIKFKNFGI